MKFYLIMLFSISSYCIAQAQYVSSGWYNATAISSYAGAGTLSWTNAIFAGSGNDTAATAGIALAALGSVNTKYIGATAYGISIPTGAVIHGISVDVRRKVTGVLIGSSIKDYKVTIIKGGVIAGTNMAATTVWPTTYGYATYGSETSDWGQTWSRDDIVNGSFGVAISSTLKAGAVALTLTAHIDQIRIAVYYDIPVPLPVQLVSFNAVSNDNTTVQLNWLTALEINNDFFDIEKSVDANNWNTIANIQGAGNSSIEQQYSYIDNAPAQGANYYRLRQCDYDGTCQYSPIAMANVTLPLPPFKLYVTNNGTIEVNGADNAMPVALTLYNINGVVQYSGTVYNNTSYQLNVNHFHKGIYIVAASAGNIQVTRKIYLN